MSADSWAECPKCESEGKAVNGTTLREDYEFYLVGFTLEIDYHCRCTDCGFEFEYENKVDTKAG